MRDAIDIVIPAQAGSAELDSAVADLAAHTSGYNLHVCIDPNVNVSECRQAAMDSLTGRYICFMDYDSHQINDGWLDEMFRVIQTAPDAAIVYSGEHWGTEELPAIVTPDPTAPWGKINYGPAACMLIDKTRIGSVKWCNALGLANGWLGGDFEEVDYAAKVRATGMNLYRATNTMFDHRGGKTTMMDFARTDRFHVIRIIEAILKQCDTSDPAWWDKLRRVQAAPDDDCMFAPSVVNPLRAIFHDLFVGHGISSPQLRRDGIVD